MRLELVMHHMGDGTVWLGTHGIPGCGGRGIAILKKHDATRLARRVRDVIKEEYAAMTADTTEDQTDG